MNKLQLFFLLRKNTKLSEKRNPMFEANQYGKYFGYLMVGVLVIEFIALGTFFGWIAATDADDVNLIFYIVPFLLIFDFFFRFMTQQTPLMLVKPYLLTPISKYAAIDCFLVQQMLDAGNLVWMTLHLMVVVNSQWYLLVRTLVNQSIWWWALPAAFYGVLVLPFLLLPDGMLDPVLDFIGDMFKKHGSLWWVFLGTAAMFFVLFAINRRLQMRLIYDEISKNEKTNLKHVSEFSALNRFGQIGEYLKLEIKSTMRNKAIRSRFIQGICFITFFSLMIAFTDIYNSEFERNFWCFYAFVFFGSVNLTKVMCPEGNYIDLLMVHEENILTLLRAKYYYYCAVLLLPLLFTLVPVFTGKFSFLMVLTYLFTTTGPVYCGLFQMAIYNKTTLPLNDKITGKNQMENKWQIIVSMVTMFGPIITTKILHVLFGADVAYTILLIIGLSMTLAEPVWMRSIYRRMMKRRYDNLDGFHSTR